MADQSFQLNKLGFHISPTNDQIMARLRDEVLSSTTDDDHVQNKFPLVRRYLFSAEPWNVFKDDDPWEISNSMEPTRKIYVLTPLNILPGRKRAARGARKGTWSGSTGEKDVVGETGSVIGTKSYFEYQIQPDPVLGHWTMYEYKLGGESYKGLESSHHAKKLVLCLITQIVDKELGSHLSWRKTPFNICYEDFKKLELFLKKRKQHEQVEVNEVQNKRRKTEIPTSSTTTTAEEFAKGEEKQTLSIEDREFATVLGDMLVEEEDDMAKKDENQQVLYDDEGGLNNQSLAYRETDQSPNMITTERNIFEFADQQQQLELANSKEEKRLNNLMASENEEDMEMDNTVFDPNLVFGWREFDWGEDWLAEFYPTEWQDQWVEVDDGQLGGTDTRTNNGSSPSIINTQEQLQSSTTTTTEEFEKREENQTLSIEDREFACDSKYMLPEETTDIVAEENQQGPNVCFNIEEFARKLLDQQNSVIIEEDPLLEENTNASDDVELLSCS